MILGQNMPNLRMAGMNSLGAFGLIPARGDLARNTLDKLEELPYVRLEPPDR